jgi:hypothetical protein
MLSPFKAEDRRFCEIQQVVIEQVILLVKEPDNPYLHTW